MSDDEHPDVAYNGKVWVRASQCDQCLYSPERIVSGQRARQITADIEGEEWATFICHKSQVSDEPTSICHAWYANFGQDNPWLRYCAVFGLVGFVG